MKYLFLIFLIYDYDKTKIKNKAYDKTKSCKKKECINKRNEFWLKWYFFILISSLIFFLILILIA